MDYFVSIPVEGTVKHDQLPSPVEVLEATDQISPVGIAHQSGKTDQGIALWWLRVHGADLPGEFVIIGGKFVSVLDA